MYLACSIILKSIWILSRGLAIAKEYLYIFQTSQWRKTFSLSNLLAQSAGVLLSLASQAYCAVLIVSWVFGSDPKAKLSTDWSGAWAEHLKYRIIYGGFEKHIWDSGLIIFGGFSATTLPSPMYIFVELNMPCPCNFRERAYSSCPLVCVHLTQMKL